MRTVAVVVIALIASASFAEQPSRESLTQPLYVLRAYVANTPTAYQGIFRYDPLVKTFTSLAPFDYSASYGFPGAARLAATADRIILQSPLYYEFELTTGRLLRRYEASDASDDGWAFHGVVVSEEQARTLGIEAGTYGFPFCPYYTSGDPCCQWTCELHAFPGYTSPTPRPFSVLLRRSLDPADSTLTAAKVIAPPASTNDPFMTLRPPHAAIALDMTRRQFWIWGAPSLWATLPISGGTIGSSTPAPVATPMPIQDVPGLTFHEATQSLFDIVEWPNSGDFLRQPTSDVTSASVIESILPRDTTTPRVDAVTSVPTALPERYVQMIQAIGEVHGLNGTFWRSDLWLYNPAVVDVDVIIRRVVRPDQISVRHLPAHGSLALRNVLNALGGGAAGDGVTLDALVIDAPYHWGAQLSAYSRTFTDASDGGTYGQAVPAVPSTVGYSTHPRPRPTVHGLPIYDHLEGTPSMFVIDQRQPGRFRHNLGVVNDGSKPLELSLIYDTTKHITVAPHTVATINIESLFDGRNPSLVTVEADRAAPVWMSVIDNISQDATFLPFEIFPLPSAPSVQITIPTVTATNGANGTSWRTDLFGFVPAVVKYQPPPETTHLDATTGCTADVQLVANVANRLIVDDVASQFRECVTNASVTGALSVTGTTWMAGYSRTYTTRADGGTFGDMLPFYPSTGWPLQHFSGVEVGSRFRINVGLYNGSTSATTNRLLLYDDSGALVALRDIVLEPHASIQSPIGALLNINLAAGLYGFSVVPLGEGRSWAYVSLVDNATGDPTNLW
ncbi:MAG: hypothetical protein QOC81_1729 [Thermoanaerobaculia bacterium]|jgi:hypothetical protein|nr:hypothetical protein [Thermoanaerobaculia bacterium]